MSEYPDGCRSCQSTTTTAHAHWRCLQGQSRRSTSNCGSEFECDLGGCPLVFTAFCNFLNKIEVRFKPLMATEVDIIFSDFHPCELVHIFLCIGDDLCLRHHGANLMSRLNLMGTQIIDPTLKSDWNVTVVYFGRWIAFRQLFMEADDIDWWVMIVTQM
jgi:hypothetical protein